MFSTARFFRAIVIGANTSRGGAGLRRSSPIADRATQIFGAMGGSDDAPIPRAFAAARTLRIADRPDEIHLRQILRQEPAARWSASRSSYITRPTD
jgi:hypothetical protein